MKRRLLVPSVVVLAGLAPVFLDSGSGSRLEAQVFTPPQEEEESVGGAGQSLGLYGFSTRFGLDLEGNPQAVLSLALDLGDLFMDRLRLRPSAEIGFGSDMDTYVVNAELIYRFTNDSEMAVPYLGAGFGIAGQDRCRLQPNCPDAWFQVALGFELKLRGQLNWLIEYHGEDALSRHRVFIGLATRRVE